MIRIVGGSCAGRRLEVPAGTDTRPTADRAREAVFSALAARDGLVGARVLDLFAGSGALGLEARSRGAASVLLVESGPRAVAVLRRNVAALGLAGVQVQADRVESMLGRDRVEAFDLVFVDPPYLYPATDLGRVLDGGAQRGWFAPDAMVVVERAARDPHWVWPEGFTPIADRRYGEAALWFGRYRASPDVGPPVSTPTDGRSD